MEDSERFWFAVRAIETLGEDKKTINLENIKVPYILTDKLLMKEGTHNGVFYPGNELKSAKVYEEKFSLYHDHNDGSQTWLGEVMPKRFDEETKEMFGDVIIVDKQMAMNLAYGAKLGLSPTIDVDKLERPDGPPVALDPNFISWSTVVKPAVRETMLNNQKKGGVRKLEDTDIDKIANRVIETLAEKQKQNLENDDKTKTIEAEKVKLQEDLDAAKAIIQKHDAALAAKEVFDLRCKEEFLSSKANEYDENRSETLKKMTSETRTALSDALDKFVIAPETLSEFTDFVKKYMSENSGATIQDAAAAFKKEKEKDKDKEKPEENETDDLKKKDGVSSRQSLQSGVANDTKNPNQSRQNLSSDNRKKNLDGALLKMMQTAQGGIPK